MIRKQGPWSVISSQNLQILLRFTNSPTFQFRQFDVHAMYGNNQVVDDWKTDTRMQPTIRL